MTPREAVRFTVGAVLVVFILAFGGWDLRHMADLADPAIVLPAADPCSIGIWANGNEYLTKACLLAHKATVVESAILQLNSPTGPLWLYRVTQK